MAVSNTPQRDRPRQIAGYASLCVVIEPDHLWTCSYVDTTDTMPPALFGVACSIYCSALYQTVREACWTLSSCNLRS